MISTKNLVFAQLEAKTIPFRLIDRATRDPIDLDGRVVTFSMRDELSSAAALIQETTTHQNQVAEATRGWTDLALSTSDLNVIRGDHVWDLWLDDERVMTGIATVEGSARHGEP